MGAGRGMALSLSSPASWGIVGLGSPGPRLGLTRLWYPGLCLGFAAAGDFVVLGLDLGNDAVRLQLLALVHLHSDGGL